jgi:hypothetical protein
MNTWGFEPKIHALLLKIKFGIRKSKFEFPFLLEGLCLPTVDFLAQVLLKKEGNLQLQLISRTFSKPNGTNQVSCHQMKGMTFGTSLPMPSYSQTIHFSKLSMKRFVNLSLSLSTAFYSIPLC